MTTVDGAYLDALQAALAGEHAAVWACGRAAGELKATARKDALDELDDRRRSRDELRSQIVSLGGTPVEAAPAYVEPFEVTGARSARRLLAHVSTALSATYADVAAATPTAGRRGPAATATRAAVRALRWGQLAQAFPGEA